MFFLTHSVDPFIYADDTNLLPTANSWSEIVTTINDELQKISQWFMANKLSVNLKKTIT
jgi:hypothetical protein